MQICTDTHTGSCVAVLSTHDVFGWPSYTCNRCRRSRNGRTHLAAPLHASACTHATRSRCICGCMHECTYASSACVYARMGARVSTPTRIHVLTQVNISSRIRARVPTCPHTIHTPASSPQSIQCIMGKFVCSLCSFCCLCSLCSLRSLRSLKACTVDHSYVTQRPLNSS